MRGVNLRDRFAIHNSECSIRTRWLDATHDDHIHGRSGGLERQAELLTDRGEALGTQCGFRSFENTSVARCSVVIPPNRTGAYPHVLRGRRTGSA